MATPRRSRMLLGVLVVLVILAAGIGAWFAFRPASGARPAAGSDTPLTQTVRASLTTQRQTVSATGTIAPRSQANLNFAVAGTVSAVPATVGQQVAKGAVLASVERTQLQASLDLAQAQLDAASANASQLRDTGKATSAQLSSADAQVTAATAKRDQARQSLADADLVSPIDGTVALVNIATGDKVAAGQSSSSGLATSNTGNGSAGGAGGASSGAGGAGQAGSGQPATGSAGSSGSGSSGAGGNSTTAQIVVIATDAWLVNAQVSPADLPQIKPDQQVEITPAGSPDKVTGTVAQVGVMASSSSGGSATFPVRVAVTGSPAGLYAGGSASVSIVVRQYTDILTVPTAAILTENGKTVVHQLVGGQQVSTEVRVGQVFGTLTEITAGLTDGDEVQVVGRSFTRSATPGAGRGGAGGDRGPGGQGSGQGQSGQGGQGSQRPARAGG